MFISAKYLEKTYPGVKQLLEITACPFTYDQFIAMEQNFLQVLEWDLQIISIYDVITHFLCQGVVFTSDRITAQNRSDI